MENKYVRIIKNGNYKGVEYKENEIWKIIEVDAKFPRVELNNKKTRVCVTHSSFQYPLEAVFLTEAEALLYEQGLYMNNDDNFYIPML